MKLLKIISIVAYLFIILMGSMIGMPLFLWLLFTSFDFGNSDQIFAIAAVLGLIISVFTILNSVQTLKVLLLDILCFLLLASPIVRLMTEVPIKQFNYWAFIIPTILFVTMYLLSIGILIWKFKLAKR